MDILPASKSSDWWTVITDNNTITGANLKDGINGPAFEKLQAQLAEAKTVPEQIGLWQTFLKNDANINEAGMPIAKKALNTWMTDGKMPSNVQAVLSKDPFATLPPLALAQLIYDKTDPASVKNYATALKDTYGNLKKADGTKEFTPAYLDSVAAGTIPQDTFDTRINNIAVKAATADLKAQGISLDDVGGAEGLASSGKLAEYLNDSTKLASAYTSTPTADSTVTGGAGNDTVPNEGITALGPYSGSISEVNTPAKMKQAVDNYDPNKGVYRAPSLDASGKLVANSTSPYSNILNGMLSGYKNPYAADYTNQLKMPETPDLTNIKKSFENNPTSKDLLKLANTAGQPYDPNAQTSLSPALSKIYQPSITNSAGKATKPGAPDTTNTTLPVVPKAGEPIVTDTSAGKVVNPPVVNPPVKTAAELAAEKAEADRLAEVNRLAAEKAEAERQAGIKTLAEKAEADRLAAEKAAVVTTPGKLTFQPVDGVVVSAEERAKNLEAARIAQEAVAKRQAEEKAEAERQAGLVALANQQAAEKAEATRLAAEKANTIFQQGNITAMPTGTAATGSNVFEKLPSNVIPNQYVSLPDNTVVQSVNPTTSNQTVSLTPTGPQPVYAATSSPTPAQNAGIVGAIDPSTLSVSSMNSNAGGVASLVGPVAPAVQASAVPSTVSSLPKYNAPAQTVINAGATQVLDSSGTPIPGRRRLGFA